MKKMSEIQSKTLRLIAETADGKSVFRIDYIPCGARQQLNVAKALISRGYANFGSPPLCWRYQDSIVITELGTEILAKMR
jgi:hypothetical protein